MDDFQGKTGTWDGQVVRMPSSSSLLFGLVIYHFACRLLLIIKCDIACCLFVFILECILLNLWVCCGDFWLEMAATNFRSHLVLHHLLLSSSSSSFFPPVYLSGNDKSRFGPNSLCGSVLSSGRVWCQGAHKCNPALRNCQWKCYHQINLRASNQAMGLLGHGSDCVNK